MAKSGQARVLTADQQQHVLNVIQDHRYPEKNRAIILISFRLGLRAQEIALLQIKEVAQLDTRTGQSNRNLKLNDIMGLPAAITKGANATGRSGSTYKRKSVGFTVENFDQAVRQIEKLARAGISINPEDFYPPLKRHSGKSRDLPLIDNELREALLEYLYIRLSKDPSLKQTDSLFISQKGTPYSPNTLQEHIAHMLRNWGGIEKASSHSGRRTLITDVIHNQKKSVKIAQKIAGHKSPSTTVIYEEPPETEIADALKCLKK